MRSVATTQQATAEPEWKSLGTPSCELRLEHTLPTGQSFRWVETSPSQYRGVVGARVVEMQQTDNDIKYRILSRGPNASPDDDTAILTDYFNLSTSLSGLSIAWSAADPRFKALSRVIPGARMLRQDPLECLFSFICSSNNHISRIHGMVTKLARYGTPLPPVAASTVVVKTDGVKKEENDSDGRDAKQQQSGGKQLEPFAFPTLDQLSAATEEDLRDAGFGYRARYIIGSVELLKEKPGGGDAWLRSLRSVSYKEALEALCDLPGVGPKVAACVCLFSLDKHDAIPVDTHVWQLAIKYYARHLKGKTLTPKLHDAVQEAFVNKFGDYAGWAHNTLFISELASMKEKLALAFGESDEEEEESDYVSGSDIKQKKKGGDGSKAAAADNVLTGSEYAVTSSDEESEDEYMPSSMKKKKTAANGTSGGNDSSVKAAAVVVEKVVDDAVKATTTKQVVVKAEGGQQPETPALDEVGGKKKTQRKRPRAVK